MASRRKSVKSFLTVVAFLVLTAIAIVVYSGDEGQRAAAENNTLYQKTRQVLIAAWSAAQGLANWNLSHDLSLGNGLIDRIKDEAKSRGIENDATAWSGLWNSIKNNWNNRGQDANNTEEINQDSPAVPDLSADFYKMVSIEDTADGRRLVLRSKSGKEYKINWPFNKK